MLIELNHVFNNEGESVLLQSQLHLADYALNGGYPFQTPVSIVGEIKNNAQIVHLSACANFVYTGQCDRCAELFSRAFSVKMEHILVRSLNDEEHDEFLVVENGVLNLDELVLTDILLELPTKMLCREDCKGLCPICGQNLNDGHCNCKKPVDPRLASLMQLLED